MVSTKKALWASLISAIIIGLIHYIAHAYFFNNPALMQSNVVFVGITVVVSTFLVAFFGMKGFKFKK